jgi:NAD(P)-dependent dehydrogenase (short-subunit alcohol dehydrogenase family)
LRASWPRSSLALASRGMDRLQRVEAQCKERGAEALAVRCDVSVEADCRNFIDRAAQRLGGIDILVNNAGVSGHAFSRT